MWCHLLSKRYTEVFLSVGFLSILISAFCRYGNCLRLTITTPELRLWISHCWLRYLFCGSLWLIVLLFDLGLLVIDRNLYSNFIVLFTLDVLSFNEYEALGAIFFSKKEQDILLQYSIIFKWDLISHRAGLFLR